MESRYASFSAFQHDKAEKFGVAATVIIHVGLNNFKPRRRQVCRPENRFTVSVSDCNLLSIFENFGRRERMHHFIRRFSGSLDDSSLSQTDQSTQIGMSTDGASQVQTAAISVKLPEFWPNTPGIWFQKVEAQFALRGIIAEQTRFDHIMCTITEQVALRVIDTIENPGTTPYTSLKAAILRAHTKSDEEKLREVLRDSDLGDRTPSQFYRHLKTVVGKSEACSEKFLMTVWEERLPPRVSAILKVANHTETALLIEAADKIFDSLNQPSVNAINSKSDPVMQELLKQNQQLLNEVSELRSRFNSFGNQRSRGRSKSRGRSGNRFRGNSSRLSDWNKDFCYYHNKFKDQAQNCQQPCSFKAANKTSKN